LSGSMPRDDVVDSLVANRLHNLGVIERNVNGGGVGIF
jgi:hypothetical protein